MSRFLGLFSHEFSMSIRRPGLWISYGLLLAFYSVVFLTPTRAGTEGTTPPVQVWQLAGRLVLQFNIFFPVLAGILAADRMQRDFRLGIHELQDSSSLTRPAYILGKYFGVLASLLLPILVWSIGLAILLPATRQAPWEMVYAMPAAVLAMTVPAFAFVTAFSLACPLVLPLRVYQILFTGYWFWGNFMNPEAFPSISNTYLEAGGNHVFQGFFGGYPTAMNLPPAYTSLDAGINLAVLAGCILAALVVLDRYLYWKAQRA